MKMAQYLAQKIKDGVADYAFVFAVDLYTRYQENVDAILIGDGRQDLVKR